MGVSVGLCPLVPASATVAAAKRPDAARANLCAALGKQAMAGNVEVLVRFMPMQVGEVSRVSLVGHPCAPARRGMRRGLAPLSVAHTRARGGRGPQ